MRIAGGRREEQRQMKDGVVSARVSRFAASCRSLRSNMEAVGVR
jgi:hypothetical protein